MRQPIDKFSTQSAIYKKYRPLYPQALFDEILEQVSARTKCWDCGTGNGQIAGRLSAYFDHVEATDISQNQLDQALRKDNINYSRQRAESTDFEDGQFDLITVGQAMHWFEHESFNQEVKRVAKPGGVVSIWGYSLIQVSWEIDELISEFNEVIVGPYWDAQRRHIDEEYDHVPFDFEPIPVDKHFSIEAHWNKDHLKGYFDSWSCVQNYKQKNNGVDPVPDLMRRLGQFWPANETKKVNFPLFMKMGRVIK